MPFILTMPKLSPTMTEGHIAKWHKSPGQYVDAGDLILEISTDKATVEHNALDPGWLRKIIVQEGEKAEVNAPLAILTETEDEAFSEADIQPQKESAPQPPAEEKKLVPTAPQTTITSSSRVFASPLAKKLAQSMGISLEGIRGTGPRGRIMSRDLPQGKEMGAPLKQEMRPSVSSISSTGRTEMLSPLRQVIAKRLQESKATIPHFYATIDVHAGKLVSLREEMKAHGLSITVNDLIVKAAGYALMEHPIVKTTFDPTTQTVTHHPHADICVAVSIDGGLITPIVSKVEEKSLTVISKEIKDLVEKAKANKLAPHEFMGGAFTISNLGMFGTSEFQAIINPPQVAILAVGAALDMPIVQNGAVVPGKVMKLTLSCDHRVVDGADAAKFLKTMKELLETPLRIIL